MVFVDIDIFIVELHPLLVRMIVRLAIFDESGDVGPVSLTQVEDDLRETSGG